eukprot:SAG31_NODE_22949_length_514_cov_1.248193_1_plen_99_part_01
MVAAKAQRRGPFVIYDVHRAGSHTLGSQLLSSLQKQLIPRLADAFAAAVPTLDSIASSERENNILQLLFDGRFVQTLFDKTPANATKVEGDGLVRIASV